MSKTTYTDQYKHEIKVGDKTIEFTIGKFSEQTAAAVLARCGETVVHVTVALGGKVDWGYFPLSVEYEEKLYASGIIKGSRWVKREGRPTDDAILKARVIDRTIRPLFPEGITNQVQIVSTVYSYDDENSHDMISLVATGLALSMSKIPFDGPVAGLRIGYKHEDQSYYLNPTESQQEELDLDLIVSGTGDSVVMVEAGANEVDEEVVLEAIDKAQKELKKICTQINKIVEKVGQEKVELVTPKTKEEKERSEKISQELSDKYTQQITDAINKQGRLEDYDLDALVDEMVAYLNEYVFNEEDSVEVEAKEVKNTVYDLMKKTARKMILDEGVRPDGRKPEEIRPIWTEVDLLPRAHGSAMFKRGATQAMTVTTLGSPSLGQTIEDIHGEEVRHYIHHYNMPPYASGEAGRFGYPKRREVGHGALAERALLPMIPSQEKFPYTIRVVSEIMSSNGSTSQASVCGSTMSLMAAGVPIKSPVAGIAMGLMSNEDLSKHVVLSDIQGLEDHIGDMDFKVAGTKKGITAIQMDIKLKGITIDILREALKQAHKGRLHIMGEMLKTISEPRTQLSSFAPKIDQVTIPVDRIGEVIGPGGKIIKEIIAQSGAEVDIDEDEERKVGVANIASSDQGAIDKAREMIENILKTVEVDEEFEGKVTRIESYGAFVEYLPGREGLTHISQMAEGFVKDPNTIVKLGDTVKVRISEIKDDGKIGLSMLTKEQAEKMKQHRQDSRGNSGGKSGGNSYNRSPRGGSSNQRGGYNNKR
ncbi:MAG: Polyribonucleotide nucleotidyltransferase [Microgenomates bacterium 39_7]|nr:MAG: Polyribonucleotide nucleotidyltransferase [Microgenomates bacterium 39_7]